MNANQRSIINWARYILDQEPLMLDTETTGVHAGAEVVDIGVVNHRGEVVYESLVRPQNGIPVESTNVHGIDEQMVENAPAWPEVYLEVAKVTHRKTVIIYNLDFDQRIIRSECERHNLPYINSRDWVCAMQKYSIFAGQKHDYGARRGQYKWHKLENAVKALGLDLPPQTHRAVDDCIYTLRLVEALAGLEVPAVAQRLI